MCFSYHYSNNHKQLFNEIFLKNVILENFKCLNPKIITYIVNSGVFLFNYVCYLPTGRMGIIFRLYSIHKYF